MLRRSPPARARTRPHVSLRPQGIWVTEPNGLTCPRPPPPPQRPLCNAASRARPANRRPRAAERKHSAHVARAAQPCEGGAGPAPRAALRRCRKPGGRPWRGPEGDAGTEPEPIRTAQQPTPPVLGSPPAAAATRSAPTGSERPLRRAPTLCNPALTRIHLHGALREGTEAARFPQKWQRRLRLSAAPPQAGGSGGRGAPSWAGRVGRPEPGPRGLRAGCSERGRRRPASGAPRGVPDNKSGGAAASCSQRTAAARAADGEGSCDHVTRAHTPSLRPPLGRPLRQLRPFAAAGAAAPLPFGSGFLSTSRCPPSPFPPPQVVFPLSPPPSPPGRPPVSDWDFPPCPPPHSPPPPVTPQVTSDGYQGPPRGAEQTGLLRPPAEPTLDLPTSSALLPPPTLQQTVKRWTLRVEPISLHSTPFGLFHPIP